MLWLLKLQIRRGRKVQTQVHTVNSNSSNSNCHCSLFSKKNPIILIFFISGCLAVPINPGKWSSVVIFHVQLGPFTCGTKRREKMASEKWYYCFLRSNVLGAFVKLRKATVGPVSLCVSVCLCVSLCAFVCLCVPLCVSPHATTASHWTDFHEILYWSIFRKSVEKSSAFIKIWEE